MPLAVSTLTPEEEEENLARQKQLRTEILVLLRDHGPESVEELYIQFFQYRMHDIRDQLNGMVKNGWVTHLSDTAVEITKAGRTMLNIQTQSLIVGTPVSNMVSEGVCFVCHHLLYRRPSSPANYATTPVIPPLSITRSLME